MKTDPRENEILLQSLTDKIIDEIETRIIPNQSRTEIFSLKKIMANIEVATISKLLSKEALAEEVKDKPSINKIGAIISSKIIQIT